MDELTLRQVCNVVNVSRRAVQGYEKARLVSATGKNERGYLLYDDYARERIRMIKLFQDMGFTVREIKEIIDGPDEKLKAALEKRLKSLQSSTLCIRHHRISLYLREKCTQVCSVNLQAKRKGYKTQVDHLQFL